MESLRAEVRGRLGFVVKINCGHMLKTPARTGRPQDVGHVCEAPGFVKIKKRYCCLLQILPHHDLIYLINYMIPFQMYKDDFWLPIVLNFRLLSQSQPRHYAQAHLKLNYQGALNFC